MRFLCCALVVLVPFYLLIRANSAWTPHPRFFPDDAVYARMCWPSGFVAYWNDFGFYRLLAVPAYALSNRVVMRASLSPVPATLIASALATVVFVRSCVCAGLSRRRGVLLAGVLLSSPLLLETLNFWSGTFNYALVLLLVAAQLRASMWARRDAKSARGYIVTACGALVALLTYEIALPFILATSAFYTRGGRARRLLAVCVACAAVLAFVGALVWAGVYWPLRFKLMAEQLASAVSGTPAPHLPAHTSSATASIPLNTLERVEMYSSLLFSFIRTGLQSLWFWGLAGALAGLSLLSRPAKENATAATTAAEKHDARLPQDLVALGFACACVACVVYLFVTKSMNARYVAFLLIYGAATLAWTKWRAASFALASLLLLQAAVAASLPVHMRDVELSAKGEVISASAGKGDVLSVDGRLARTPWGKRFLSNETVDLLKQPLGGRACRYSVPCEECK